MKLNLGKNEPNRLGRQSGRVLPRSISVRIRCPSILRPFASLFAALHLKQQAKASEFKNGTIKQMNNDYSGPVCAHQNYCWLENRTFGGQVGEVLAYVKITATYYCQ